MNERTKGLAIATFAAAIVGCSQSTQSGVGTEQAQTQALAGSSSASNGDGPDGRRHPHGPPPEAFTACEGKATNEPCTVSLGGDRTLAGKCIAPPPWASDNRNACVPPPSHMHPPPPPPEAFDACNGKTADAACTVALPDRTLDGKCVLPPPDANEKRLVCAPPHPPGPPPGPPPVH